MKITLQGTGYSPFTIEVRRYWVSHQTLEKRGVKLTIYEGVDGKWWCEIKYITNWEIERGFVWAFGWGTLHDVESWVRLISKSILPPGAGYPATESYATRQSKLVGQMETITLVALTDVLRQIHEAGAS